MSKQRVVIMGAAGRDFHNFNTYFRNNEDYEVVGFTAAQIPDIEGREYPPELSGPLYPDGIPIYPEERLPELAQELDIDQAVFSYSDVSHEHVMHVASKCLSIGVDFKLLSAQSTMLESKVPMITITAVRTGIGKSQTTRRVTDILREMGKKVVVIRHPMPYGDLTKQICQRYETYDDLDKYDCTIEEREEYEPHIDRGLIVYAGVDYEKILRSAEEEADVIVWDGGNNDFAFYKPDIQFTLVDPHRPGHEMSYHPGEGNFRLADAFIINKIETATPEGREEVRKNIREHRPDAEVIEAASPLFVEDGKKIKGKRVLVVEDGPTLTHGGMSYGAGVVAAKKYGAAELVDPREAAVGSIKDTFAEYTHIGNLLPAMGYGEKQMEELKATIDNADCDLVVVGTPIDLRRLIEFDKPALRVRYELQEIGEPTLEDILSERL